MVWTLLLVSCVLLTACQSAPSVPSTLKVLALGSKTSEDAVEQYLWDIAHADGRQILTGNAYVPACTLEKHYGFIQSGENAYSYRKVQMEDGQRIVTDSVTLKQILQDEDWDYVSIQQLISLSSDFATFEPYLDTILAFLRANLPAKTKILFHHTWSYGPNATNADFDNFSRDGQKMFEAICECTKKVLNREEITGVIPSGTAVQLARQTALGNDLTRDNIHMGLDKGRYIVALTWYETLFNTSCQGNTYHPSGVSEQEAVLCQKAAHEACQKPF